MAASCRFGRDYIIPTPFDPRLIYVIPPAVAKAGMDTGVARRPIIDLKAYEQSLKARMDPTASDPAGHPCPRHGRRRRG